ncbi:hypothetical protein PTNB73_09924 [Pyrenophora teres f. teres]|nr:hypothetical protein HRS9122_08154 [Pyrenophora teres f. teres]KAE8855638.1 hypothetical protein PTNB73_09924 [Pyrenophora teres f. teres]
MGSLSAGLITLTLLYVASRLWHLNYNYRAARATGLPMVICPYDPDSVFHAILSVPLRPVFRFLLPSPLFAIVELSIWGWEFRDKAAIHEKLGPAFIFVTTGLNRLVCADPYMAHAIMMKRKDFVHTEITYKAMGFLGANIITAKDDSWSRQRRIVAPALSERISQEVWTESMEQASSLVNTLLLPSTSHSAEKGSEAITGLRAIAMNVLVRIAYGYSKPFSLPHSSAQPSARVSYVDAISLCTELLVLAAFIPGILLRLPIMPRLLQTLGAAVKQLPDLTRDMLDQERSNSSSTLSNGRSTIMSTLVCLSDQGKDESLKESRFPVEMNHQKTEASSTGGLYLTEEEIVGNLFIFTAAGFDTTANTMSYAITLLAAYPEWQTWIQAEIDTVLGDSLGGIDGKSPLPEYRTVFPKMKRCLAVMVSLNNLAHTFPETLEYSQSSYITSN